MTPSIIVLEVHLLLTETGDIKSFHKFRSPEDEQTASEWPSHGQGQIAHGLLTEAVRREAYLSTLVKMTGQPDLLQTYKESPEDRKREIEEILGKEVQVIVAKTVEKMGSDAARGVLKMMVDQMPGGGK